MPSNDANSQDADGRLSQMQTHWSKMHDPHVEVCRYLGPVNRYFLSIVREPGKAAELTQLFAERFLSRDFQKRAERGKGRFRDYLKQSLRNMCKDIWRKEQAENRRFRPLVLLGLASPAPSRDDNSLNAAIDAAFREEWLKYAWNRLADDNRGDGAPYFVVLKLKSDRPDLSSGEIAAQLNRELKLKLTAASVRKIIERARDKFGDFLLDEVLRSLPAVEHDQLEDELIDLQLLEYCKPALNRRQALLAQTGATNPS